MFKLASQLTRSPSQKALWAAVALTVVAVALLPVRLAVGTVTILAGMLVAYGLLAAFALALVMAPAESRRTRR